MSSSNISHGDGPHVDIAPERFEVMFQLVAQLRELPDQRLADYRLTRADVGYLMDALGQLRDVVKRTPYIRLTVDLDAADTYAAVPSCLRIEDSSSVVEASVAMSPRITRELSNALAYVMTWLGDRELFFRTGYQMDAARDIIVMLSRVTE